jgi:hypothetical protein
VEVTSNINTPKNVSRNLNSTSINCENATASEKWLWGIIVSVINSIVALIIFVEVIYLLPRLPVFNSSGVGWSGDSEFVIEYLLGKPYNVLGESEPLTSIETNSPHCSTQDHNSPDSVAQACSTMNDSIRDSRNQDTPDSIDQECTTVDNGIQDSGTEDCIDVYKKQVLNRSRDPGIIYGPNTNINDLYIDVVIHTERAQHKFSKEMERHEI